MAYTKFRYNTPDNQKSWIQLEAQQREANEKFGYRCYYITKEVFKESMSNGVYLQAIMQHGQEIYLRQEGLELLGEDNMFTKFGYEINNQLFVYGTISQFDDLDVSVKPKIGDLVYIEDTNKKLFEVSFADFESKNNKYPFGKPMNYMLKLKIHNVDLINFYNTNNDDVDTSNTEDVQTDEKYKKEIEDKITDYNILDNSEDNPLLDE